MPLQTVKVAFDPDDIALLDRDANAAGISRAELIRNRTLTRSTGSRPFTTADYHRLVTEAYTHTNGIFDRRHVESLVAWTLNKILT